MTHARRLSIAVSALLAVLAAACGSSGQAPPTAPSTPADLVGQITSVVPAGEFPGTIRVEANPGIANAGAKAIVKVLGSTTILLVAGTPGQFRALAIGQWVRVWFNGPVAESYPVQGVAAAVVVDSLGVSLMNRVVP
jgi:ABC-type Fe3+-hydroxamate transport system substrate-binding protein